MQRKLIHSRKDQMTTKESLEIIKAALEKEGIDLSKCTIEEIINALSAKLLLTRKLKKH